MADYDEIRAQREAEEEARLDEEAEQLARDMVDCLPRVMRDRLEYMDKERMPKRMKQDLLATMFLGVAESPVFRPRMARDILKHPLAFAKLQVALVPKNVTVESDVRVQHTIVVPATQSIEAWMADRTVETTTGGRWLENKESGFEEVFGVVGAEVEVDRAG